MWYIVIVLCLWLGVYLAPALACSPQLLRYPQTAAVLPLLSILIVTLLVDVLSTMHLFSGPILQWLTVCLIPIAMWRVWRYCQNASWSAWELWHGRILLLHTAILFPYLIKIGTKAFDTDDEIYSWHYWALQWFYGESISFEHTGAPYPQAFSKLIAYCYQLLGTVEYQLPVKATLILLPFCMMNAIAFCGQMRDIKRLWAYVIICLGYVFGLDWQKYFDYAYAEPLMNASLAASVALCWFASQQASWVERKNTLLLSVSLGLLACWSKQAALVWGLFSLPLLILWMKDRNISWRPLIGLSVLSVAGATWWLLGEGAQFQHNDGVIGASMGNRQIVEQLGFAAHRYFVELPHFAVLYIWGAYAAWSQPLLRRIFLLFVLPGTFLWFLFGAYHLRLGLQIISVLSLCIIAADYPILLPWLQTFKKRQSNLGWYPHAISVMLCLSLLGAIWVYQKSPIYRYQLSPYEGGHVALRKFFGEDTDKIYQTIYGNPDVTLLVSANYIRGLFYTHTKTIWPSYQGRSIEGYGEKELIQDLLSQRPDYVMTSGNLLQGEPMNHLMASLHDQYPEAIKIDSHAPNLHGYITYKIDYGYLR